MNIASNFRIETCFVLISVIVYVLVILSVIFLLNDLTRFRYVDNYSYLKCPRVISVSINLVPVVNIYIFIYIKKCQKIICKPCYQTDYFKLLPYLHKLYIT